MYETVFENTLIAENSFETSRALFPFGTKINLESLKQFNIFFLN